MKTVIVGNGEIGKSLYNCLKPHYPTDIYDIVKEENNPDIKSFNYNILHICFPYFDGFVDEVKRYQKLFGVEHTVIHSTVPIGTSKKCYATHSPIEGLHPFLEESLLTFTKFLGGEDAVNVADYFRRANFKIYLTDKSESTELMKTMSTTFYGLQIEFTKEMKRQCTKYEVPFELFTLWNMNYNDSYEELGHPEYKKPLLVPIMKGQGGHCTQSNAVILHETNVAKDFSEMLMKGGYNSPMKDKLKDRVWLYCEYWGKRKEIVDISKELGVSETKLRNAFLENRIPLRTEQVSLEKIKEIIKWSSMGEDAESISNKINEFEVKIPASEEKEKEW